MTNEEVKQILINTYAKDDSELSMFNIEMRNAIFYCEDGEWILKLNVSKKLLGKAIYSIFGAIKEHNKNLEKQLMEQKRLEENKTKEYMFNVGEKFSNLEVEVLSSIGFESAYDMTYLNRFQTKDGNIIVWWTSASYEVGQKLIMKGTIKDHKEYKSEKQTVVTRCKTELIEDDKKVIEDKKNEIEVSCYNFIKQLIDNEDVVSEVKIRLLSLYSRDELKIWYGDSGLLKKITEMYKTYLDSDDYICSTIFNFVV